MARTSRAAIVGVLLLSHAFGLLHPSLVRHGLCPEHGELIELDDRPESRVAAPGVVTVPEQAAASIQSAPPAATHGIDHQHCNVAARPANALAVGSPGSAILLASGLAAGNPRPLATPPGSLAPLRVAPKSSPPV